MAAALKNEATTVTATESVTTVLAFPGCPAAAITRSFTPSVAERLELDRLRWLALRSLIAPKPDLERACFLLSGDPDVSLSRFSIAFFRGLSDKARREMVFYRPGAKAVSDDEIWLLRLAAAWRAGDESGARALIAWRVQPDAQRWLRFLSAGMVRMLDTGTDFITTG
ncbi:hypothetical protein Sa4125_36370 [Aureimonas sp. SA4125]|uniref:hypothetical protein n=1 Tax=Aureimonas sp. SA4125 TaxID=2826993 RepID=UPI001CC78216|nr:hypothetical protein [Aureimonas sp. SA4125]BDA86095.1 hypothetical protein Sa4125_36370 [Aureimonas sp. SA4125]